MKFRKTLIFTIFNPFLIQHAYSQQVQEKDDIQTLDSRITAVTVYADRARVTREATLPLPAESNRFSFAKLPSWIDEGFRSWDVLIAGTHDCSPIWAN